MTLEQRVSELERKIEDMTKRPDLPEFNQLEFERAILQDPKHGLSTYLASHRMPE
jgi:hypothetical protein